MLHLINDDITTVSPEILELIQELHQAHGSKHVQTRQLLSYFKLYVYLLKEQPEVGLKGKDTDLVKSYYEEFFSIQRPNLPTVEQIRNACSQDWPEEICQDQRIQMTDSENFRNLGDYVG